VKKALKYATENRHELFESNDKQHPHD
jgi:hypothetical protein